MQENETYWWKKGFVLGEREWLVVQFDYYYCNQNKITWKCKLSTLMLIQFAFLSKVT